jgi:hypothetical protein
LKHERNKLKLFKEEMREDEFKKHYLNDFLIEREGGSNT